MFIEKQALLLDMNNTFMFGEDRFDEDQDFSIRYRQLGGMLSGRELNGLIRKVYSYLDEIYPTEEYRHNFPTTENTLIELSERELSQPEIDKIVDTFAYHELGEIPQEYVKVLHDLSEHFELAVVIDIWSPKRLWLEEFERAGVDALFSASSYSSDHGMVKPSPQPFELVVKELGIKKSEALVIGDSVSRDLGGAHAAGIDCILVGGAIHSDAAASFSTLLEFGESCRETTDNGVPLHIGQG